MAEMGKYCKAYCAEDLGQFDGWEAKIGNLRPEIKRENREEIEVDRAELQDDDVLYIQENYVVTDGIFKDEHIVFDRVTDSWKSFCTETLGFEIPDDEPIEIPAAQETTDGEAQAGG